MEKIIKELIVVAVIANQNLNLDNIKSIIFDFDGTLYNFVPAIKGATQDILKQFDIDHPVDDAVEEFLDLMEDRFHPRLTKQPLTR